MWTNIVIILILMIIIVFIIYHKTKNNSNRNNIYNFVLTGLVLFLTVVLVAQTDYIQQLTSNDVPNFPTEEYRIDILGTNNYIDSGFGNYIIYDVDYVIKYSKMKPPKTFNFSISLPTKVEGFIIVEDSRGFKIDYLADSQNDTVEIINENKINPLLLHVVYVSEKQINPKFLTFGVPLPDINNNSISNNSFYVKIKNTGGYDIRTLRLHSNLTEWMNIYLIQLDSSSWIEQPIMIYDNGLPVEQKIVNGDGNISWYINSINSGEHKVYYFKKINEYTHDQS